MTNSGIAQRQAEIDARVAAVTPGEWVATDGFVFTSFVQETSRGSLPLFAQGRVVLTAGNADAEFCANAKLDLEWQRERIKALEAEVEVEHKRYVESRRAGKAWFKRTVFYEEIERADHARIAALENAARSCATCLYHTSDLEPVPEYCNTHCRKPDIRHAGWVFNEKRWANKEAAVNDKS